MIAVRLKDHGAVDSVMASIEAMPSLGVKAARWDAASGFYAQIASGLQAFIYLATALVFLVVALIFMNTLIINVTERTAEIGTMRAIGSDKSFIRGLFVAEALALNVTAVLGRHGLRGRGDRARLARAGIRLPELVSQFLIGGGTLASMRRAPCPSSWPSALVRRRVRPRHPLPGPRSHLDNAAQGDERKVGGSNGQLHGAGLQERLPKSAGGASPSASTTRSWPSS